MELMLSTSGSPSIHYSSWIRWLGEDDETTATTTTAMMNNDGNDGFSKAVWAVNVSILLLIVIIAISCWIRNGCMYTSTTASVTASDLAYARVVLERQRIEDERRQGGGTPEQRSKRIRQEFKRTNAVMTVSEEDIIGPQRQRPSVVGANNDTNDDQQEDTTTTVHDVMIENVNTVNNDSTHDNSHHDDDGPDLELGSSSSSIADSRVSSSESLDRTHHLSIPATSRRQVPASCAICLSRYQVDDRVVFNNNGCPHAFHEDCMVDWLVTSVVSQGAFSCPCCRQEFVSLENQRPSFKKRAREVLARWGVVV